jgi:hypothetical protein
VKTAKAPKVPGHKCEGVKVQVSVACECGWRSSAWYAGKGARQSAYAEWRSHVDKCRGGDQ